MYTAINVPYCALGAVITPNQRERVSLNGYRFFLALAGGAMIAATTIPLVGLLGQGDPRRGFPLTIALFGLVAVVLFWACFAFTRERVHQAASQASNLWADVKHLLGNDQWLVVAAMNFVLFIALAIRDGAAIYYVRWYLDRPALIGAFLTTGMLSSMIGALFAGPLAERLSKVAAYSTLQAAIVSFSLAIFFVDAGNVVLVFALYALLQFTTQMASPFLWSMMADSVDYGEYVTGRRITGLTFSGALFALKMGMAAGGAILGWLLGYFDYASQASEQSPRTILGIVALFTIAPALGHGLLIAIVRLYRLNDARCEEIRQELDRRIGSPEA
jgi:glycoside/pentoside/hexuronide:cation symporter, GPH family